jgi:hypothetical protein
MNETEINVSKIFPNGLLEWVGNRSGGVKRLFDDTSGRPAEILLNTNLLFRLSQWTSTASSVNSPKVILLIGGPGNGKTEAIENTIIQLDEHFNLQGRLVDEARQKFHPKQGVAMHRKVEVDFPNPSSDRSFVRFQIVQDATSTFGSGNSSPAKLLLEELEFATSIHDDVDNYYLCCVNRGVLDESFVIASTENRSSKHLIKEIIDSISLSSSDSPCWPLNNFTSVAVWPMDIESLLQPLDNGDKAPALSILEHATQPESWRKFGDCSAGELCPFCSSEKILSKPDPRIALISILRWYEVTAGKRWNFRDLFAIFSFLLAGNRIDSQADSASPCDWAALQLNLDKESVKSTSPTKKSLLAIYKLVGSSYQQALFHTWDKKASSIISQDLKDLGIKRNCDEMKSVFGLQLFLAERQSSHLPETIGDLLVSLSEKLDPALARSEYVVNINSKTKLELEEIDARFSRAINIGLDYLKPMHVLTKSEVALLLRLSTADEYLSIPTVRRKKPTSATRLQQLIRDFSCRLVRRSLGARFGVVLGMDYLIQFQKIIEDQDGQQLQEVAKQVRKLLNGEDGFEVPLVTTFAQPAPPLHRQAMLIIPPVKVSPIALRSKQRPRSPLCFLRIGAKDSGQSIALTYELFQAIKDLEMGLSPASLANEVVALIDTTKARFSGQFIRSEDVVDDSLIRIGAKSVEISKVFNGFNVTYGDN